MLTVYGFLDTASYRSHRVALQRIMVPRDTSKVEKSATLRSLCDLVAVQYGCAYKLRSKLPSTEKTK